VKIFFWTMVAVVAGIWVYSRFAMKGKPMGKRTITALDGLFQGPDIDASTGAYNPPDARPGTVQFPAQGN